MINFEYLKELLDEMAGKYYPGIDMCIWQNHKQIFRHQSGYSDVENKIPVNPKGLYYFFSCTKPITCTAVMQLLEKGKILLTDPVKMYLPEFADVVVEAADEMGKTHLVKPNTDITIKHLLTMTAGLSYDLDTEYIRNVIEETEGKNPTRQMVRAFAKQPLSFHPGEKYRYSLCHDVLGAVIEVVSGKKLSQYMQENIFEPCGMSNTGFLVTDDVKKRIMPVYQNDMDNKTCSRIETSNPFILGENSEYESGGAGLIGTVDDYIKFADALANGGVSANGNRIISQKSIDVMRTPAVDRNMFQGGKVAEGYEYGFGVRTFVHPGMGGQLSNIGEFGWDGAAGSYVMIDPSENLAVFAAEHVRNPYNHDAAARFTNAIYTALSNK